MRIQTLRTRRARHSHQRPRQKTEARPGASPRVHRYGHRGPREASAHPHGFPPCGCTTSFSALLTFLSFVGQSCQLNAGRHDTAGKAAATIEKFHDGITGGGENFGERSFAGEQVSEGTLLLFLLLFLGHQEVGQAPPTTPAAPMLCPALRWTPAMDPAHLRLKP